MRRTIRFSEVAALCFLTISPSLLAARADKPTAGSTASQVQKAALHIVGDKDFESSFTWQELQEESATVSVANDSDVTQHVTVQGGQLTLLNAAAVGKSDTVLNVNPSEPQNIKPHEIATFHLQVNPNSVGFSGPGNFAGTLRIDNGNPKAILYQRIKISIPSTRPALTKVSVLVHQWLFGLCSPRAKVKVPLVGNPTPPSLPRTVGFVQLDERSLPVQWTAIEQQSKDSSTPLAVLEIENLRGAGRYEGQINLAGLADKEIQTTLTVIVKDGWLWPIAVILFETVLAFLAKRYLGVTRAILSARKSEAELGPAFAAAQHQFQVVAKSEPYSAFSIGEDLVARRADILNRLNQLWSTTAVSIANDSVYVKTTNELTQLKADIQLWPAVATAACDLMGGITAASAIKNTADTVPPDRYPLDPALFLRLYQRLQGHPIKCDEVAVLQKQFQDGAALVELWKAAYINAASVSQQFNVAMRDRPSPSDEETATLNAIESSLGNAWTKLFFEDNDVAIKEDLIAAIEALNSLKPVIKARSLRPDDVPALSVHRLANAELAFITLQSKAIQRLDDTTQAQYLSWLIVIGDVASTILAFFIALLTGLNANYLGNKPWGTVQDYVVLFLWTAGTKVGLDIVTAVTDKFLSTTSSAS